MSHRWFLLGSLFAVIAVNGLTAQELPRLRPGAMRQLPRTQQALPPDSSQAERKLLQRRIRQGFWRAAKVRIGFTDEQMTRIEQTTQRFDQRRRVLGQEEVALRLSLRSETLADTSANQATIAAALDRLTQLQHQRLDLQSEEQKEFSAFMTPLQRAKFLALQDQVRKRMTELTRGRPDSTRSPNVTPDAP